MSMIAAAASSSSSSSSYKICLVCEPLQCGVFDIGYEVFVVDVGPSSDGRPGVLSNPLFRIPNGYPDGMNFFAFGSRIYFLGGYKDEEDPSNRFLDHYYGYSVDVFVYDTSSRGSSIKKASCMNYPKVDPVIIGPVNEKFYVISKILEHHDFEQFDPKLDSWVCLRQPPRLSETIQHAFSAYAVVNNDREILLSTPGGLYSYKIDSDEWSFYENASIPFLNGPPRYVTGCAVATGGDRFSGFIKRKNDSHMVLGSYRYNNSDHTWHDFQYIFDWPSKMEYAYPMSLGDGVISTVVSGYDRPGAQSNRRGPVFDLNDDPESNRQSRGFESDYDSDFDNDPGPFTHYISITNFGNVPNFKRLCSRQYKEEYNMEREMKITAAFLL